MSFYGDTIFPEYVSADNEIKLKEVLKEIQLQSNAKIHIIQIYPKGSKVYAWYERDILRSPKPPRDEKEKNQSKKQGKKLAKK